MDIKELEQVIKILKENAITEFELIEDGTHIKLSRAALVASVPTTAQPQAPASLAPAAAVSAVPTVTAAPVMAAAPAAAAPAQEENVDAHLTRVESPIVGTFYRKPSPDDDNFVSEGDVVKKGDTLCIVEAMKLMNEIESPCSGKIVKISLADGQVAEFGELLFLIDPRV